MNEIKLNRVVIIMSLVCVLCMSAVGQVHTGYVPDDMMTNPVEPTSLVFDGLTRPSKHIGLSLRVPGIITIRPIEEGQWVKAGQLIAELDSAPEEAVVRISQQLADNDSEVHEAEVNENLRWDELERQQKLSDKFLSSVWELRVSQYAFELAMAQAETARFRSKLRRQELIRDQARLARRQLRAPFDGYIWRTLKEVGEAVALDERDPIAVLVSLDPLWVELNLGLAHFGRVVVGQEAMVTVHEHSRTAKVISVDPLLDSGSSTFRVRLELANQDKLFIAGVPAKVRFELDNKFNNAAKRTRKKAKTVNYRLKD